MVLLQAEIEKVKRRREDREREREERERENEQLQRDRAAAEAVELEEKEDEVKHICKLEIPLYVWHCTFYDYSFPARTHIPSLLRVKSS